MNEFYLLGFWSNAYRAGDREYFWARADSRKEALARGKRLQEQGQPQTFYDWCKGTNRTFSSLEKFTEAANKVGLNPRILDIE
jgi:hypothetical protein